MADEYRPLFSYKQHAQASIGEAAYTIYEEIADALLSWLEGWWFCSHMVGKELTSSFNRPISLSIEPSKKTASQTDRAGIIQLADSRNILLIQVSSMKSMSFSVTPIPRVVLMDADSLPQETEGICLGKLNSPYWSKVNNHVGASGVDKYHQNRCQYAKYVPSYLVLLVTTHFIRLTLG